MSIVRAHGNCGCEVCSVERETSDGQARPGPPGSYVGIASQIWAWLLLDHLGAADQEGPVLASALAQMLPRSIQACQERDLLTGTAGSKRCQSGFGWRRPLLHQKEQLADVPAG